MVFHIVEDLNDYYKNIMDKKWAGKLIICYFTATWCGPCRMISPDITTLGEKSDSLLVLKIDVDDCEEVASQCEITCMPTFKFHIGNNIDPVKDLSGADKVALYNIIGELLKQIKTESENKQHIEPIKKNDEMDVPFLYNPIPEHKFN